MGAGLSTPETPAIQLQMEAAPNYPDMNVIFKGIPKMMQVADDMHRMTNYIMDLRNMTFGLSIISMVGMLLFVLLKYVQGKNSRRRRRRFHALDSDQTSLSRTGEIGNGSSGTVNGATGRYYSQKHHPSQFMSNLDWNTSRHIPIDMEKLLESQHSNSTAATQHHVNQTHNIANNAIFHRQTPPQQQYTPYSRITSHYPHHHHNYSVNGGGPTNGSATSGITTATVALGELSSDLNDQTKGPYSHAVSAISTTSTTVVTTIASTNNSTGIMACSSSMINGVVNSNPLIISNGMNGGVTSAHPHGALSSSAAPVKVSGVPSLKSVLSVAVTTSR